MMIFIQNRDAPTKPIASSLSKVSYVRHIQKSEDSNDSFKRTKPFNKLYYTAQILLFFCACLRLQKSHFGLYIIYVD